MYKSGKEYIYDLDGMGYRMPKVFLIFTVSGMALMGVPGLCGFISKWKLVEAALDNGTVLAYVGIGALLVSALLTAVYMISISVRAFFPGKSFDDVHIQNVEDPNWMMLLPLVIFVIAMILFGLHPQPVIELLETIASAV